MVIRTKRTKKRSRRTCKNKQRSRDFHRYHSDHIQDRHDHEFPVYIPTKKKEIQIPSNKIKVIIIRIKSRSPEPRSMFYDFDESFFDQLSDSE
jgi:hypothetical protein